MSQEAWCLVCLKKPDVFFVLQSTMFQMQITTVLVWHKHELLVKYEYYLCVMWLSMSHKGRDHKKKLPGNHMSKKPS